MRTQAEIEQSIRDNLPIIFARSESVDRRAFLEKYNALVDYATTVSQPFLTAETTRYQSILLYVSLIFVSVSLFQIGNVKIGESLVSVNRRFLVIYTIFIAAITLIFLLKVHLDSERARLVRSRNAESYNELDQLLSIGRLKKSIQEYFWLEVFDVIGRAYKAYDDAQSEAQNSSPNFKFVSMQVMNLDREALCRDSELATEIAAQEKHLAALTTELAEDETRFMDKAKTILSARSQPQDDLDMQLPSDYDRIREAYDQCLGNWFDARNALNKEHASLKRKEMTDDPELHKLKAMSTVLEGIANIRGRYAKLEVSAPVVFAFGAILYVWLR